MADIDDRWYRTIEEPNGKSRRVPTARHGKGKRWDVRWRDDTGRQRHRAFERKQDAEGFLVQVKADLARGTYTDPAAGKVTVRAYAESWLAAQTSDPSTREATELRLRLHVLPELGGRGGSVGSVSSVDALHTTLAGSTARFDRSKEGRNGTPEGTTRHHPEARQDLAVRILGAAGRRRQEADLARWLLG